MTRPGFQAVGRSGECWQLFGVRQLGPFRHGFSTRLGGCSEAPYDRLNLGFSTGDDPQRVRDNRTRFLEAIGSSASHLLTLRQVHSAEAVLVARGDRLPPVPPEGDALVTNCPDILIGVMTADCYPILLADPVGGAVAAVHAGWRGTVAGIVGRTIAVMEERFGSSREHLQALIGPGVGACCYQVGGEVREAFQAGPPGAGVECLVPDGGREPGVGARWRLDLLSANRGQLAAAGVRADHIQSVGGCTVCRPDLYFSYRRDGDPTGRMLSVIGLAG